MAETWHVRTRSTDTQGFDGDAALAWDAPFVIYNGSSADVLEVRDFGVELANCVDINQGFIGKFQVRGISGVVGGDTMVPIKHVSSAGDLPSQVLCRQLPWSVTLTGFYRQFAPIPMLRAGIFASTFCWPRLKAEMNGKASLAGVFSVFDQDSMQPFVLREGEGICLFGGNGGVAFNMRGTMYLRVISTGATYSLPFGFDPAGNGRAVWAVFNGSGSGIVLEVRHIAVTEECESSNIIPKYRVLHGPMTLIGGQDLERTPAVSSTSALAGTIKTVRNAFVRLDEFRTEPWYWGQQMQELTAVYTQFGPMFQHQNVGHRVLDWQRPQRPPHMLLAAPWDRVGRSPRQGWRLNKGEGLAIVWPAKQGPAGATMSYIDVMPTGFQNFDFYATFTREAAAGSNYPIEDDVRLGITYGDFEGEYEGDLVLPDEADVKAGVDYGADGTEFEGTYSPTGGGGVSRGRVVNP